MLNVEWRTNVLAGKNQTFCERFCRVLVENSPWNFITVSQVKQARREISKLILGGRGGGYPPLLQDLCSTGKNWNYRVLNVWIKFSCLPGYINKINGKITMNAFSSRMVGQLFLFWNLVHSRIEQLTYNFILLFCLTCPCFLFSFLFG